MRPKNWVELGQGEEVEFDVHCKMRKCWAHEFLSLLKDMQRLGEMGSSRFRGMYCDGDGDFRPKFTHNFNEFVETSPRIDKGADEGLFWDAG